MLIQDNTVLERKQPHFGEKIALYPPLPTSLELLGSIYEKFNLTQKPSYRLH